MKFRRGAMNLREILYPEDGHRDRIVENERWHIVELVRRAPHGYAQCGA